jgi:LPS export ABC transporter permease LptG
MVLMFIVAAVLTFSIMVVCNNFYLSSDLLFVKKIPFSSVAIINLLDAPATIVLSLPVACLFGVMLAIGQLGRQSEITAMRCGGVSLLRIMVPVLVLSLLLSVATYLLDEHVVPMASDRSFELKSQLEGAEAINLKQNQFFRNDRGIVIYAGSYDVDSEVMSRMLVLEKLENGWVRFYTAYTGRFSGDELVIPSSRTFVFNEQGELRGREQRQEVRFEFPEELQKIHEEKRDASTLAGGEIAQQISRAQQAGMDPVAYQTDLQFKYSTPVACFIFSFVGFIFSVHSPRKEIFVGLLYAIILVLVYYVLISVFKSFGKQGIIPYPLISAWSTNLAYLVFGIYIFARSRR